jgi:hypothetical protein
MLRRTAHPFTQPLAVGISHDDHIGPVMRCKVGQRFAWWTFNEVLPLSGHTVVVGQCDK